MASPILPNMKSRYRHCWLAGLLSQEHGRIVVRIDRIDALLMP